MRGIVSAAGYLPRHRLDRSTIAPVAGAGGGKGTRTVASYDEDTTTMAVEAGRLALRSAATSAGGGGAVPRPDALWFATTAPAYLDKTNATAIHAALRLDDDVAALDMAGAVRSAVGAVGVALRAGGTGTVLVTTADVRGGLAGGPDESAGGDGAAALLIGDDSDGVGDNGDGGDGSDGGGGSGPVIAEYLGGASVTEEFLDRWRTPGDVRSKVWEERFGETRYAALGERAWQEALKRVGIEAADVDRAIVTSTHARAARAVTNRLGVAKESVVDDLATTVGHTGAAHPGLLLATALESAAPGQVLALVSLADGADVLVFRTTDAVAAYRPARPVAAQVAAGALLPYGTYLRWRGLLPVEPPRRPEPARVSASAAGRSEDWKFGFVARRDPATGDPQLPPRPSGGDPVPMADVAGTIVTFTVDRLAYSPSPPIVFAVVDFDGGGRFPVELTDVAADEVGIGDRVEMTFRRLSTADGIHNYFWKARPLLGGEH